MCFLTNAWILSENPIRLRLSENSSVWHGFDGWSFEISKIYHRWRHINQIWAFLWKLLRNLNLQTFFSRKMKKMEFILSWRLLERILNKITWNAFHSSTQAFFSIPVVHRLDLRLTLSLFYHLIWEIYILLTYGNEFCHGKMAFFECFLPFDSQKIRFLVWKRYKN